MADLEKTISIIFAGKNEVGKTLQNVSKKMDDLSGSVQDVTQPLANAHDKVLMLEAALGALAVGGLYVSLKAAGEFSAQFGEITTLIDETGASVDQFKTDLRNYAAESTASFSEVNAAVYAAISAGVDYKDALDVLTQAEQLAVAGKAGLSDALTLVVSSLNAYGEEADQAKQYSDVFFETVRKGQTTLPELAGSLAQVTGLAASGSVPIEELTAAIATLTASGMPTTQAITSIKGALTNIIKPSSQAATLAEELGVEFNAAALESKGLEGVLLDVKEATGGNIEQMAGLFGSVRGLNGALVLTGESSKTFSQNILAMEKASGSVSTAYDKMIGDINQSTDQLKNTAMITLADIGLRFEEEYVDLADAIRDMFQGIRVGLDEGAFDEVFAVVNGFGSDLSEALSIIAQNLPEALGDVDFSGLTESIDDLLASVLDVFNALFQEDLTTSEGLTKAIQKLVDGMEALTEVVDGIVEGWEPWFKLLGDTLEGLTGFDEETNKAIGSALQLGKTVNVLAGFVGDLSGVLEGLGLLLKTLAAKTIIDTVGGFKTLRTAATSTGSALTGMAGATAQLVGKAGLVGLAGAAGYAAGTLINEYVPGVDKASQSLLGWIDGIVDFSGKQEAANKEAKSFDNLVETLARNIDNFTYDLSGLKDELAALGYDIENLPDDTIIRLAAEADLLSFEEVQDILKTKIPEEKTIEVNVDNQEVGVSISEDDSVADIMTKLESMQQEKEVPVKVDDQGSAKATREKIEEVIDPEKKLELETELKLANIDRNIAEIEARAKTMDNAFEWEAKVEMSQIEAGLEKYKSAMESVTSGMEATTQGISDLFGTWFGGDDLSFRQQWAIEDAIDQGFDIQKQQAELQKGLIQEQIRTMQAKREAMEKGEGLIQIESTGLEPELEAFLWKIREKIQVRANEEASEFLLGIGS